MDHQNSDMVDVPPVNRFLVWAVYFMGAILVLLFIGLIAGIIYKIKHRAIIPEGTTYVDLNLPAETLAREAMVSGDKLTINTGSEVIVLDISSRKILLRVNVADR